MSFSERHQRMLLAMGIRVWQPVATAPVAPESRAGATVARPAAESLALQPAPAQAAAPAPLKAPATAEPVASPAAVVASPLARTAAQQPSPPRPAPPAAAAPYPLGPIPDASRLDWAELRDAVSNCRACGLCTSRTQTVFGVGHPQAQWLVLGEAPGEQEDLQGEPFVGAAGQLLDNMLRALQLTRAADCDTPAAQRVYIANTLKCRPPRNRNPEPGEMQRCEPYLQRQLQLLQPRIILAMGRFAIQSLLRSSEPVGKLRGRVHQYQGIPLIVTYHPAYLLRTPLDKARAWDDLCLAAEVFERGSAAAPV